MDALNLALKSPASLEPDVAVITAEHDDDRPLLLEDGAATSEVGAGPERARFRRELRLARNPNMVTPLLVTHS